MGGKRLNLRELGTAAAFSLAAISAIIALWVLFGGTIPLQPKGYRFDVAFGEARTLVANADVRIAGIPVGKVVEVSPGEERTKAVIELEPRYAPLPGDARAIVRTKTPLGESYVEITRGSPRAEPIPDGGTMRAANVQPSQQIEQVLGAFDEPTRKAFRTFMVDGAAALKGQGVDLNQALGATGPAVEDLGTVVDALDAQSQDVEQLVSSTSVALRALGERPDDLRSLVRSGEEVLGATAGRDRELTATVRAFAPFVRVLRPAMADVERSLALAAPTLKTLRPVTPLLAPALEEADRLAPVATKLFRDLRPFLRSVESSSGPAARLIRVVRPAATALDRSGAEAIPPLQLLTAYRDDVVWNAGTAAASFAYPRISGGGTLTRSARAALTFTTSQGLIGSETRPRDHRGNPYPAPGSQIEQTAWECSHASKPAGVPPAAGSQVPCVEEGPWEFGGLKRSFPQLDAYEPEVPGAATAARGRSGR